MEDIIFEENEQSEGEEFAETAENVETAPMEEETLPQRSLDTVDFHLMEMKDRFPDVNIRQLEKNSSFRRFAGSRYGKESLADLYESYKDIVGGAEKAASQKVAAKASRSTGGSSGKSAGALSSDQREALRRWNEANSDMKMSEKEFLGRD